MRLIDRDVLIAEYDRVHVGEPGGARELMVEAPTVDAIPMDYIAKRALAYSDMAQQSQGRDFEMASYAEHVLNLLMIAWVKEKYR